ncbi:uncharacterized protein METZ01_LOCUS185229 [marine metagenome]|uniref:Uncharacterized protein n=1 Tax=marine metagenome TaxID=408172 RepID=A0A382D233_9ZZZZ
MALKPPPASSEAVRNTMLANRSTDTGPEKAVRRMLREAGRPGYRLHWRNVERDRRKAAALLGMGWGVHTIWECQIENGVDELIGTDLCGDLRRDA